MGMDGRVLRLSEWDHNGIRVVRAPGNEATAKAKAAEAEPSSQCAAHTTSTP